MRGVGEEKKSRKPPCGQESEEKKEDATQFRGRLKNIHPAQFARTRTFSGFLKEERRLLPKITDRSRSDVSGVRPATSPSTE